MAVKPSKADSASGRIELDQLNEIRLSRNWSYQELADDMERLGHPVPSKTLQTLINRRPPRPYDRTLYQVRAYLVDLDREIVPRDEQPKAVAP